MNLAQIFALSFSIYINLLLTDSFLKHCSFTLGLVNHTGFSYKPLIISCILYVGTISWVIIVFLMSLRRHGKTRFFLILIGASTLLTFLYLVNSSPQYVEFTKGFHVWVKSNVDTNSIQNWRRRIQPKVEQTSPIAIDKAQWDAQIVRLNPADILYFPETEELRLVWGGGFGHWGISLNTQAPEKANEKEYRINLSEYNFTWHEIQ